MLSDPFHLYDQHWWSKLVEIIEDLWLVSLWLGTMGSLGESTSGRWRSSQAGGSSLVRLALVPSLTLHPGMRPDLSSSFSNFPSTIVSILGAFL